MNNLKKVKYEILLENETKKEIENLFTKIFYELQLHKYNDNTLLNAAIIENLKIQTLIDFCDLKNEKFETRIINLELGGYIYLERDSKPNYKIKIGFKGQSNED